MSAYYEYQAEARGLRCEADVESVVQWMATAYAQILLPRWLPPERTAAIYEVACGPGIMLRYLQRAGYGNVSGSDSSACQIALAQAAGLNVAQADSLKELAGHRDGSWDCVIGIDFIEHLPKDVLLEFLALAARKLKPGGRLILRGPNADSPLVGRNLYNDITHVWAYTTIALRGLLQMSGFERLEFAEDCEALVGTQRWLKVPLMRLAQALARGLIRAATREQVEWLSPSIYVCAWKK